MVSLDGDTAARYTGPRALPAHDLPPSRASATARDPRSLTAAVVELFTPPPGTDSTAIRLSLVVPGVVQGLYSTMAVSTAVSEVVGAAMLRELAEE